MFIPSKNKNNNSPIVEVIILTVITVILVSIVYVVVFNIGDNVSETSDATVQLTQVDDGIQATVIRNENVDSFILSGSYDDKIQDEHKPTMKNVGDSAIYLEKYNNNNLDSKATLNDGDTVYVIAILENGTEEVLTSTQYKS